MRFTSRGAGRLPDLMTGYMVHKVLWSVNKKIQYGVNMGHYVVCLVTIDDLGKAAEIARSLVEKELVACVNIIPQIRSIYFWQGKVCDDSERLMLMKTRKERFPDVQKAVKALHPYQVPEIIALDISDGLPEYLKWIDDCTGARA